MLNDDSKCFDPCHSELEKDPYALEVYLRCLENAFGRGVRITGVLEIGSFAKGEAVNSSDTDTRVYVTSDEGYLFNTSPRLPDRPILYDQFLLENGSRPSIDLDWSDFNNPIAEKISTQLPRSIEFGFADSRYALYELKHLDGCASPEHSLLLQSQILYDPDGMLSRLRFELIGKFFAPLAVYYQTQHLDHLWGRIYEAIRPGPDDDFKLQKSGQILWVNLAVRCLRNAVAAKSYISCGKFLYRKEDVLKFYRDYLPGDFPIVKKLYDWKTDAAIREAMVREFLKNNAPYFTLFRETMPELESVVTHVKGVSPDCIQIANLP